MWKTKTKRKTGEKVAVAKAYSSTILDRKSPIQSVGSPAMQPPYPMEESNQDRKRDAVIESITSHYSWIHYIEGRYSTREKGRTKGRLLWFNWTVWTRYLISSHGRALEGIGVDIYIGFMWFEANHYVLQETPMCSYVYLMKALKSLLTLTCLNQARFKNQSITSKMRLSQKTWAPLRELQSN